MIARLGSALTFGLVKTVDVGKWEWHCIPIPSGPDSPTTESLEDAEVTVPKIHFNHEGEEGSHRRRLPLRQPRLHVRSNPTPPQRAVGRPATLRASASPHTNQPICTPFPGSPQQPAPRGVLFDTGGANPCSSPFLIQSYT